MVIYGYALIWWKRLTWARMHDTVLVYAETSGYVGTSKSETS